MMLTFKVQARYGIDNRVFTQNVIGITPEMAGKVAERFIRSKMMGDDQLAPVSILEVREVRY